MSDAWDEIQAIKNKQISLREKIAARRKKIADDRTQQLPESSQSQPTSSQIDDSVSLPKFGSSDQNPVSSVLILKSSSKSDLTLNESFQDKTDLNLKQEVLSQSELKNIEKLLLMLLNESTLNLPMKINFIFNSILKLFGKPFPSECIEDLLKKYAIQGLVTLEEVDEIIILTVDQRKLTALYELEFKPNIKEETISTLNNEKIDRKRKLEKLNNSIGKKKKKEVSKEDQLIESLLSTQSAKERESNRSIEEILTLLSKPSAKELLLSERFRSQNGKQVKEFCGYGTREECQKNNIICDRLHFKKIIRKHTDETLGDCSFLNTCFHMDTCKYVHYQIDDSSVNKRIHIVNDRQIISTSNFNDSSDELTASKLDDTTTTLFPAQWIQCDLRQMDMSVLGKFAVVMADPPWDIHMELPYGTMSDEEMRKLNIPVLQDEGYIFLWVTGRAMELGRECLTLWGYERVDELIWVKTNQLQRIIRTGRTGHWLNHGKEHCLVGVKGNLPVNRGLDCDVIVSEVRATSHKPDEIYGIIERLSPGTRKIELFGRPHNVQPNWVTLGNQVDGVKLLDPEMVKAFRKVYPDGNCMK